MLFGLGLLVTGCAFARAPAAAGVSDLDGLRRLQIERLLAAQRALVDGALPGLFAPLGHRDRVAQTYARALPDASANERALAMVTDALFRMPAVRLAELDRPGPTWVYRFDWRPRRQAEPVGAMHGIDVAALFGTRWPGVAEHGPPPAVTAALWHAVGRFARSGDPGADWPGYRRGRADRAAQGAGYSVGAPGPSGMSKPIHSDIMTVHAMPKATEYGSIAAMSVPRPASRS